MALTALLGLGSLTACGSSSGTSATATSVTTTATASSTTTAATASKPFKVCMGTGSATFNWAIGQGQLLQSIAKKEGWSSVVLNNNASATTTLSNVSTFILDKCNAVIEFSNVTSVNPILAQKLAAAHIPTITYDIAQAGWYFVGIDNLKAGIEGGKALGAAIKQKWNCNIDQLLAAENYKVGLVNTERTDGMITGVLDVCPNLKNSVTKFVGNGDISSSLPAARSVMAAHPTWTKMAAVGINDDSVVGTLEAAQQLGRGQDIIGWGQGGDLITGANVNPDLIGSVFYFLEGYPEWTLPLLKDIAAGKPPAMGDSTTNPTVLIPPCLTTKAQASSIPDFGTRLQKMMTVNPGTTENSLYCPAG